MSNDRVVLLEVENHHLRQELEATKERVYFWKHQALIMGYSGGARKLAPPLTLRSRMKNCLFQLIHTKEKNNA